MPKEIKSARFTVLPCANNSNRKEKEKAYKVRIDFLDDEDNVHSTQKLVIFPEKDLVLSDDNPVVDVYSFNGTTTPRFFGSMNFSRNVAEECCATAGASDARIQLISSPQVLFVLDIKDDFEQGNNSRSYQDLEAIRKTEQDFVAFLQGKPPADQKVTAHATKFRNALKSVQTAHVLLEGQLKAHIIKRFSIEQQQFLQTRGMGVAVFCQLTEFFLNAFKRGEEVVIKTKDELGSTLSLMPYQRHSFMQKIDPNARDYKPTNCSVTIYPPLYYQIATEGLYTQAMKASQGLFSITIMPQQGGVVEMITMRNN